MSAFNSLEEMYLSLFQQCVELPKRNKEMELSIFQTLVQDQRYDLILEGLGKGLSVTPKVHEMILESGDLKLYQYLHSIRKLNLRSQKTLHFAIKSGNLETVIWLFGVVPRRFKDSITIAIKYDQVVIVKWLYSQGYSLPEDAWRWAIVYSSQVIFEWLLEIKHPFHPWICGKCIQDGKLEVLQWFRAHGCPWDRNECLMIANYKGLNHIVKWIESQPE